MAATAPSLGLENARPISLWIDAVAAPAPQPPLKNHVETDLLVVGGGYTGLWTAILAKEENPNRSVTLIEATQCGQAGSGRNGGFCSPSLTHGLANGLKRWPKEIDTLVRLGHENLREIGETLQRYGVDADFQMVGRVAFARTTWEADELQAAAIVNTAHGDPATFIPLEDLPTWTASPSYVAGMHSPNYGLVDPYKLVLGLRHICLTLGVVMYESTPALSLNASNREFINVATPAGSVQARHVALATNFKRPLLPRMDLLTVPVYDYAIVTQPLTEEQFAAIGWQGDVGHTDSGNQFHYYRKTPDGRILWGGYDAIYNFGSASDEEKTQRPETFQKLAAQFRETYPQLADVTFTHQWGGVIDSSTRFCMTTGTAARGRVAYAVGFTGLGVSASRFGARVMLDLLSGASTERTRLGMIRRGALPFPPEPIRYLGVQLTRWSMARQDATGNRNLWLRMMDALGLGFDS